MNNITRLIVDLLIDLNNLFHFYTLCLGPFREFFLVVRQKMVYFDV